MARLRAIVSDGRGKPIPAAEAAVQAFLDGLDDSVMDAFLAAHTEETTVYRDSRADAWRPIMDQAYEILDAHKGDIQRPYLKVVRRGGKPPSTKTAEQKLIEARERAAKARAAALLHGKQVNVILPEEVVKRARAIMQQRGIPSMAALIEMLVNEASMEETSS